MTPLATEVLQFELRSPHGAPLPAFAPGAHVNVHLPTGFSRSYSLTNEGSACDRYTLSVQLARSGRGGSAWLHTHARVGMQINVSEPINHFPLAEDAAHSVFIAGGIGIAPIWCMVQQLSKIQCSWELHYRARSRASAAFIRELLQPPYVQRVHPSFSDEQNLQVDFEKILENAPPATHFYCCGPPSMLSSFETACKDIDQHHVHLERFSNNLDFSTAGGYQVKLTRSNRVVEVKPGQTILASLHAHGVTVPSSCEQGVCGACETRVVEGLVDHRDLVLSNEEKTVGASMMICCSGSRAPLLVLDL